MALEKPYRLCRSLTDDEKKLIRHILRSWKPQRMLAAQPEDFDEVAVDISVSLLSAISAVFDRHLAQLSLSYFKEGKKKGAASRMACSLKNTASLTDLGPTLSPGAIRREGLPRVSIANLAFMWLELPFMFVLTLRTFERNTHQTSKHQHMRK
jgi:hypothetical protein